MIKRKNNLKPPVLQQVICSKCNHLGQVLTGFYAYSNRVCVLCSCMLCGRVTEINLKEDAKKQITINKPSSKNYLG